MYSDKEPYNRRSDVRRGDGRFPDRGDTHGQRRRGYERKNRLSKRPRAQLEQTPEQNILQTLLDLIDVQLTSAAVCPLMCDFVVSLETS